MTTIAGPGKLRPQDEGRSQAPPAAERHDLGVLRSLRRIIRAVDIHSRQLALRHKITAPQLVCLMHLVEEGSVTVTGLARAVHLSPSTVIGILDRLEVKRLVSRQRDASDRRRVLVSASEAGRVLVDNAPSPLQETLAEALVGLPESEQRTIALSLERIVDLMEARHIDASPILQTGPIEPREPVERPPDGADQRTEAAHPAP